MLTALDRIKRHLVSLASSLPLPRKDQIPLVFLHVVFPIDAQITRRSINPLRWPLDFCKIADRRFVNHNVPFPALPLLAKFFIAKARLELQRSQNGCHLGAIRYTRLGFNSAFVSAFF